MRWRVPTASASLGTSDSKTLVQRGCIPIGCHRGQKSIGIWRWRRQRLDLAVHLYILCLMVIASPTRVGGRHRGGGTLVSCRTHDI